MILLKSEVTTTAGVVCVFPDSMITDQHLLASPSSCIRVSSTTRIQADCAVRLIGSAAVSSWELSLRNHVHCKCGKASPNQDDV